MEVTSLEKTPKKRIGKLKIGLVLSTIVIVVLAGLNIWFYMNKTSLESQLKERWDAYGSELWWHSYYQNAYNLEVSYYNDYVANHHYTDSEYNYLNSTYNSLVSTYNNYVATHHHTDSEYNDYTATHSHTDTEYDALKAPNLIKVAWNEVDVHSGTWHLHVWGAVVNVGTDTAYNCKIHVVCYQGAVIGLDTYVLLYTIAGETSKWVDQNLYYAYGSGLTNWSVTLEWTATP